MTKREQVEEYIYTLMKQFDQFNGNNLERYKQLFSSMNNSAFDQYMHDLKDGHTQLNVILPNNVSTMTTNKIVELAKQRNVKLFSKIYLHDPNTGRRYQTKYPMMTVILPIRRLSQYLFHKISLPESDTHVNPLTGQVIPPDKGASLSMIETQVLASKGLETSIVELIKIRSGDMNAYRAMKYTVEENGEVLIADLPLSGRPRSVLTAQRYFHALGVESSL